MAESKGKCDNLKALDLFTTKLAVEKKHKTLFGVFFTVIMVALLIGYGLFSAMETLNTPYVWEVKEFKKSQEYTGNFMTYPFQNNLTFGIGPLMRWDGHIIGNITDYGEIYSFAFLSDNIYAEWPMSNCLNNESVSSEVSFYE